MMRYIAITFTGKMPANELALHIDYYFEASGFCFDKKSIKDMAKMVCSGAGEILGIVEDESKALVSIAIIRHGESVMQVCIHPDYPDSAALLMQEALEIQNRKLH